MKKIFVYVFFIPLMLNASKYSDFVDALYYERVGDYKKSFDTVQNIIKKDTDPYLYKYLYSVASRAGMNKEITEIASKIVEIDSTTADNWIIYGNSLAGQGKKLEAEKAYKKAVEIDPDNVEAYYQLAVISSDNIIESEKYFKKIVEIDPSFKSDSYYNIGVLYSMKKDEKKMKEYMEIAIKSDQYNLKPYYFMAMYYDEKGDLVNAIEWYRKLFDIEQTDGISNRIAELYLSKKDYLMAEKYFSKAIEINPSNSKSLWWLSLLAEEKKDYEKATKYLFSIKGWEDDVEAVLKMSYFNIMKNDLKSAVNILRDASQKWPDNLEITYYLALGLMDESNSDNDKEIKRLFELVVSSKPNSYEARYNLAIVCERLNDIECFERNFRILIDKNPNDHSVLNYLGYSLIDRDLKLEEAIKMVEKAVSLDNENSAYLDSLAWGYYKKGDYDKALTYIEKSIAFLSKYNREHDPIIYEHYADILFKLSRYDRSYENYRIAVIGGSQYKDRINSKVMSMMDKIDPYVLIADMALNSSEFKNNAEFKVELKTKYKKFLKKKEMKFTFNGFWESFPEEKYFSINILGPLYTIVLSIEMDDKKYNFKSDILDDRISHSDIERYSVLIEKILRWYNQSFYYFDFKNNIRSIKYLNRCFHYTDVFKKADLLKLCVDKNPFAFEIIEYKSDIDLKMKAFDFRVLKIDYSDFFSYYIPYSYEFEFGSSILKFSVDKIEIKYGK